MTITKDQLKGFHAETRLFANHSKTLDMYADPVRNVMWFITRSKKTPVYDGPNLDKAIIAYNRIR